ncbi:MAG: hypothetical protein P4L72_15845 [Parvibaculum sp.]|uniref:helix-hairpin-helix domain-containing protein n=1 Tax=Parvibaculum sp. TaxID=2024848 RepID=UPI00284EB811|nr:hypothetical protein [Parvibaculum sp.]MDR3500687.1 hypothetical protein [Parvibaculum sp.]
MTAKALPFVKSERGVVRLTEPIARGGEGTIYGVDGQPLLVAKIYHKAVSSEKAQKLELVMATRSEQLAAMTAWPAEILRTSSGAVCGFLMPRVKGHKDIHLLYSPKSRRSEFPNADWRFLVRVASNVARAFSAVHQAGHVIGDVNHGSVVVSQQATVKLIDCDSFQISAAGKCFPCEVGIPTFTPPELQGQPFRGMVRTANHDNFGLSVLIFMLLFMNRHPFAGRFRGAGDMPIDKAIKEFRFAYGISHALAQMDPPPNVLQLRNISQPVASLFERAFARGSTSPGARPSAIQWATTLADLEKQLKQCKLNASHYYSDAGDGCPWCGLEAANGVVLFNVFVKAGSGGGTFNIDVIWQQISSIPSPGPAPALKSPSEFGAIKPAAGAVEAGHAQQYFQIAQVVFPLATLIFGIGFEPSLTFLWVVAGILTFAGIRSGFKPTASEAFRPVLKMADANWHTAKSRYDREAGDQRFRQKLSSLEEQRTKWRNLPTVRQNRYQQLVRDVEKSQRQRYLEGIYIENAKIQGIGPGRKAMLESYNIETAWDVRSANIVQVPGFGPALTSQLMAWRQSVEAHFLFDPRKGVDARDIAALDRDIANEKRTLEQALRAGSQELTQIRHQTMVQRSALKLQAEQALQSHLQAQADGKAARL